jgi:hypothetical protein
VTPAARRHAWTCIGAAALLVVVATIATVALVVRDRDPGRLQAIAITAGICLAGSLGGWIVGRLAFTDPGQAVAVGLAAVCLRFFPALAALAWLQSAGVRLREHGAAKWLLVFYLAVLATDILLHMIGARVAPGGGARSEN